MGYHERSVERQCRRQTEYAPFKIFCQKQRSLIDSHLLLVGMGSVVAAFSVFVFGWTFVLSVEAPSDAPVT